MPNKSKSNIYNIPYSVVQIVYALCRDMSRWETLITARHVPKSTKANIKTIGKAFNTAKTTFDSPVVYEIIISDIINGRGYDYSSKATGIMSKNTYYRYKKKLVRLIAENLHII